MYTSSTCQSNTIPEQYDVIECNDLVNTYTDRFMIVFEMQASDRDHVMLTDDPFATYMEFCHLGLDQVAIHMRNTYQFHVNTLSASLNNRNDQPDGDGEGRGAQNQL